MVKHHKIYYLAQKLGYFHKKTIYLFSDGKMDLHEDRFGFQHGKRDSPLQTMLYTCQILKHKYTMLLQVTCLYVCL